MNFDGDGAVEITSLSIMLPAQVDLSDCSEVTADSETVEIVGEGDRMGWCQCLI